MNSKCDFRVFRAFLHVRTGDLPKTFRFDARENGVILHSRLTSQGTRVYCYRTSLFGTVRGKMRPTIAAIFQDHSGDFGRPWRRPGARHQKVNCYNEINKLFSSSYMISAPRSSVLREHHSENPRR